MESAMQRKFPDHYCFLTCLKGEGGVRGIHLVARWLQPRCSEFYTEPSK